MKTAFILSALAAVAHGAKPTHDYPFTGACADKNVVAIATFGGYCPDLAGAGFCGGFPLDASGYSAVSHMCPVSCGICEHGGDGSYRQGEDFDDFMVTQAYGASCGDLARGYCGGTPFLTQLCQHTCKPDCETKGFYAPSVLSFLTNEEGAFMNGETCSGVPYGECHDMRYGAAEDLCESWGAHVCHIDELADGQAHGAWTTRFGADIPMRWFQSYDYDDFRHLQYGDDTCHKNQETWVHPQAIGNCKVGGGNVGHSVVPLGPKIADYVGSIDSNDDLEEFMHKSCRAHNHEAKALCCFEEGNTPYYNSRINDRKLLATEQADLPSRQKMEVKPEFQAKLDAMKAKLAK